MAADKVQPVVLAAGLLVVGGLVAYSMRKKSRCEKLPDIYAPEGPLHLTPDAQDLAYEAARYKLREHLLAGEPRKFDEVVLYVADELRDCAWEKLKTDEQKAVWAGIKHIVNEVNQRAANPDEFLGSF